MSTKKKRGGGGAGEDFKQEDVLQAVVIADSFNVRFAPITNDKPRVSGSFHFEAIGNFLFFLHMWCDATKFFKHLLLE